MCAKCFRVKALRMFMNNFHILSIYAVDMLIQMLDGSHWRGLKNNGEYVGEQTE